MKTSGIISPLWLLLTLQLSALGSIRLMLFDKEQHVMQEGGVRLVGRSLSEGRVEVYHDGQWGTVCDDDWDKVEADVVCRQLGYRAAVSAVEGGMYGEGSGPIWMDDLKCKGAESSLSSCSFKGWAITDCSHKEDAGVVCETDVNSDQEYSLDNSLALSEELGALFDRTDGCDFQILFSVTGEGQQTFCVHRIILALHPQLNITNSSSLSAEVSQVCGPYLSSFVRYLYTRKIDVTLSSAQCVHQLASCFGLKKLLGEVGRLFKLLLTDDITYKTQVSLYEYAVRTEDLVLQENCLQYLSWNCEPLINSTQWANISLHMMEALISRSDVVVRNEAILLLALESWIQEKGGSLSHEEQAMLLGHIRFPMIPAEQLLDIQFTSDLYKEHQALYQGAMLRGFQFNALPFSKLRNHLDSQSDDFIPRLYTADPWSLRVTIKYNDRNRSFRTPVHNSVILKTRAITWHVQVFKSFYECSNNGVRCDSVPAARLFSNDLHQYKNTVRFNNKLFLTCGENVVFQVQDFKNTMSMILTNNSLSFSNPCPETYSLRMVVRPEYV